MMSNEREHLELEVVIHDTLRIIDEALHLGILLLAQRQRGNNLLLVDELLCIAVAAVRRRGG
jgi:hypothetical protein